MIETMTGTVRIHNNSYKAIRGWWKPEKREFGRSPDSSELNVPLEPLSAGESFTLRMLKWTDLLNGLV